MGFGISLVVYKPHTFFEVVECLKLGYWESRALCTVNECIREYKTRLREEKRRRPIWKCVVKLSAKCDRLLDCMGLYKLHLRRVYLGENGKNLSNDIHLPSTKVPPQAVLTLSFVWVIPGGVLWCLVMSQLWRQHGSFGVGSEKHTVHRPEVRYGQVAPLRHWSEPRRSW